ncbi:MAG: hypothetical protein AAB428_03195 [Patescibacteria group bacterium]
MIKFKNITFIRITTEAFSLNASYLPANARATIRVVLDKAMYLHYYLFNRMPRIRRWQAGL